MQNTCDLASSKHISVTGSKQLHRRELFTWMVVSMLANHSIHVLNFGSFSALTQSLASSNLIYWFAYYVIIHSLFNSNPKTVASRLDLTVVLVGAVALCISSLIGYRFGVGLLTTLGAFYLLWTHYGDLPLKVAGAVLLALSAHLVWGPVFFNYFTPQLLVADVAAVGAVLSSLRPDITILGSTFIAANDHSITLVGACSSFQNVSIALLASVTITMYVRPYWVRSDFIWIFAICVIMVFFNVTRISAMIWDAETYQYYHHGPGVRILALIQTVTIWVMSYLGAYFGKQTT